MVELPSIRVRIKTEFGASDKSVGPIDTLLGTGMKAQSPTKNEEKLKCLRKQWIV